MAYAGFKKIKSTRRGNKKVLVLLSGQQTYGSLLRSRDLAKLLRARVKIVAVAPHLRMRDGLRTLNRLVGRGKGAVVCKPDPEIIAEKMC